MLETIRDWIIFWIVIMMPWMIPVLLLLLVLYYIFKSAAAVVGAKVGDIKMSKAPGKKPKAKKVAK